MIGTRTVWGRTAAALVISLLLTACGVADEPTMAAPGSSVVEGHDRTTARAVPAPSDGALQVRLAGPDAPTADPREVLLFGDSVAVLLADELATELPATTLHVDAVDCRRLDLAFTGPCGGVPAGTAVPTGLDGLRDVVDGSGGSTPDAAVLLIANNAALDRDDLDAAMAALARVPRVWWVTTDVAGRGWRDPNNALLHDLADRDGRAGVIDWFAASRDEDWRADHVHPNEEGQAVLAARIADHLRCDCVP